MFNQDRLELEYKSPQLIIRKSAKVQIKIIFYSIVSVILFLMAFENAKENFHFVVCLLIAVTAFALYKPIRIVISKEYFIIDQGTQKIYKKEATLARFDSVSFVEIETVSDGDSDAYRLSIRLKNKSEIRIDKSSRESEIRRVAGEIAYYLDKEVKIK